MRYCSIVDCNNKHVGKGFCMNHWKLNQRNGKPVKQDSRHGMSYTPTYETWHGMIQRSRIDSPNNKYHAARGITLDDSWRDFKLFYKDMGERPKGMSIDRIDNNKGYNKDNCRWANPTQQTLNRNIPKNNTSGYMGVKVRSEYSPARYSAFLAINGKRNNLGVYETIDEAISVRLMAESVYSDFF